MAAVWMASLAWPVAASAAACCIGSTSGTARLGPCEVFAAPLSLGVEVLAGAWSRDGALRSETRGARITATATAGAAFRLDHHLQVSASLPLLLQGRRLGDEGEVGGGPGDLRLGALINPRPYQDFGPGPPAPLFGLSVALPTGIPWDAVPGSNGARVTGTGYLSLTPSVALYRTFSGGSIELDAQVTQALPRPDDRQRRVPGMGWGASFSGAIFLRTWATLSLSTGADGVTPSLKQGVPRGWASVEPWASLSAIFKVAGTDRLSVALRGSLPLPGLGRSHEATVGVTVGYTIARRSWPGPPPPLVRGDRSGGRTPPLDM